MALNGTEYLEVVGNYHGGNPCGLTERTTTQAIADLGGGGGFVHEQVVSSGTTNTTLLLGTVVLWNSATSGAKTNAIPTSTGSKKTITISDVSGTAYTDAITAVPVSGSIINNQSQVYTNFGSLTLYDSSLGWVGIT